MASALTVNRLYLVIKAKYSTQTDERIMLSTRGGEIKSLWKNDCIAVYKCTRCTENAFLHQKDQILLYSSLIFYVIMKKIPMFDWIYGVYS